MKSSSPQLLAAQERADDQTAVQDELAQRRSRELSERPAAPPASVPGYEIIHSIGEGSFGSVWLAREVNTGKQVAIKFYSHRRGLDWSLLSREVEKLAVLYTSRNVVGLLDVGWDHDPPYFVMEYLEQGSLAQSLRDGAIPTEDAVRIAKSVARALVHAHGSGILHCDVKPANVLLDGNREARLGDFGQSRLSDDQSPALGTLFYMAPEQADLDAVPDARWDVYALGALLYHMLCGQPPYRTDANEASIRGAKSLGERLGEYRRIIESSPRPAGHDRQPGVDRRLKEIVDRCLHVDPQQRYPNAQAVLDALDQRDELRAKRPLIAVGFLGPILFLVAMFIIAQAAVPRAREAAESNLVDRALKGDAVTADILAGSVSQELWFRQEVLEALADGPLLRELLEVTRTMSDEELFAACAAEVDLRGADVGPIEELKQLKFGNDQRLREANRSEDVSWFVTDAAGRQVFRLPANDTLGVNFAYRDYYHNLGRELDPGGDLSGIRPRTTPGVSRPFRSRATEKYMVAIAVPIWDEPHERVIGILARTIHLTDLLDQWESRIQGQEPQVHQRFLALVDTHPQAGLILDHEWMTPEHLAEWSDEELEDLLRLDADQLAEVKETTFSRDYRDPIAAIDRTYDVDWLAAFAPVGRTQWVAVVQENKRETLRPVDELQTVFFRYGVAAVVVFSVMLGILWYLIHRWST